MRFVLLMIVMIFFVGCSTKYTPVTYENNLQELIAKRGDISLHVDEKKFYELWDNELTQKDLDDFLWVKNAFGGSYYGEDFLKREPSWFEELKKNANFEEFNTQPKNALTTTNSYLRALPTDKPAFLDPKKAGEGYPFDYLQNSYIPIVQPLKITHYSKDRTWVHVKSNYGLGWLKSFDVLGIDFYTKELIQNAPKVAVVTDDTLLHVEDRAISLKVGTILPLKNGEPFVFVPHKTSAQSKFLQSWPLEFNDENILKITQNFIDEPYGWGGTYSNRDCSLLIRDYFTSFGILYPRNSFAQYLHGDKTNISSFTNSQKEEFIIQNATPFITTIYQRGHILLYLGQIDSKAIVLHNVWGLRANDIWGETRVMIAKGVVSDLRLGEDNPFVKEENYFLSRIVGISSPKEANLEK